MRTSIPSRPYSWVCAVLLLVSTLLEPVAGWPSGAPFSACSSGMTPGHGSESSSALPYSISISPSTYTAGASITVTVSGGSFQGIMMQVQEVGSNTPHGRWTTFATNTRAQQCSSADDTVTHENTNAKNNAVFVWEAPDDLTANLEVVATVAQAKFVWWKEVKSSPLTFDVPTTTTTTTATTTTTTSSGQSPTVNGGANAAPDPTTSQPDSSQNGNTQGGTASSAASDNVPASIRRAAYALSVIVLTTVVSQLLQ